ncbi:hypothetical protein FEM48_Zijuj12G0089800 [Ziziphus jujuba var. spinosa]|uniref:Transposase-associated domain-containing protein n=1 Tax=Ziziphus jujuba var. spinosa TaxID=714518 RepID=A0A978UCD5_ZIZJJ|nr:hypothetical protein FEM48_Zijuj12G0089800 [Ziziphus jujuba var. spinosa]
MADWHSYIIVFLVWLISTILFRSIFTKTKTKLRLPPSPLSLPIIGHLHLLAPLPHQALYKLSIRYGPIIHLSLGSNPCVVASSPEVAKEFLKTHETSFSNRPKGIAVDYLTYGSADFSFAPYGPYWKFMKKLCMSELLGGRTLEQLLPVRREEIKMFLELMLKKADANEAVDVGGELTRVTNNVISRMVMSQRCSENENEADQVRKLVKETAELTGKFNLSDYIGFCKNIDLQGFRKRLKEVRENFDTMMEWIIKEHEQARKKEKKINGGGDDHGVKDLLDILLDIAEDERSEIRLTRENIKAFILMDRSWMLLGNRVLPEYVNGVNDFLKFSINHMDNGNTIRCPCYKCNNYCWLTPDQMRDHLVIHGIVKVYNPWVYHGEMAAAASESEYNKDDSNDVVDDDIDIVGDGTWDMLHELNNESLFNDWTSSSTSNCAVGDVSIDSNFFTKLFTDAMLPFEHKGLERDNVEDIELIQLESDGCNIGVHDLKSIARGLDRFALQYAGCMINGHRFRILEHEPFQQYECNAVDNDDTTDDLVQPLIQTDMDDIMIDVNATACLNIREGSATYDDEDNDTDLGD